MAKGRPPGAPNKDKQALIDKAAALGCDPFTFLCMVMTNDWKGLKLKQIEVPIKETGLVRLEDPMIAFDQRYGAAKDLAQYLYPKRSSVKVSADEESGFRVIIEDFTIKDKK